MITASTETIPEVHAISGTRYHGCFADARVLDATTQDVLELRGDATGFVVVQSTASRVAGCYRPEDLFTTEAEARAAAKARRAPRRPRRSVALYGDFAQLAAFSGIATDGSGRVNRTGRQA